MTDEELLAIEARVELDVLWPQDSIALLAEVDRLKAALHQIAFYADQDMFLSLAPAVMMKGIAADALRGQERKHADRP